MAPSSDVLLCRVEVLALRQEAALGLKLELLDLKHSHSEDQALLLQGTIMPSLQTADSQQYTTKRPPSVRRADGRRICTFERVFVPNFPLAVEPQT